MPRYLKHTISYGETMQSIASRYYNDISQWTTIVDANNLRYPYIVDTNEDKIAQGVEHVVTIGDNLIIPTQVSVSDVPTSSLTPSDKDEIEVLWLGKDLSLMGASSNLDKGGHDGVLEFSADGKGSFATVAGVNNLKQSLVLRLMTAKGSLLLHPTYGSNIERLLGQKNTEMLAEQVDVDIQETVLTDSRVNSCVKSTSTIEGGTYESVWLITPVGIDTAFSFVINGDTSGNFNIYDTTNTVRYADA